MILAMFRTESDTNLGVFLEYLGSKLIEYSNHGVCLNDCRCQRVNVTATVLTKRSYKVYSKVRFFCSIVEYNADNEMIVNLEYQF